MIITYYGQAMVKLQLGDLTILIDPAKKRPDLKIPKLSADIALISSAKISDQENIGNSQEPFIIDGPGEYEVKDTFIQGLQTNGPGEEINTIYAIGLEGLRLVHLGALAQADLPAEIREELGEIDILFLPIGDEETLDYKQAAKLSTAMSPKIIIPILYYDKIDSTFLTNFLKETGNPEIKAVDKLSIKPKDVMIKQAEVLLLAPVSKV